LSFTAVQKVSAYESIVDQIERAVETGELKAGDRLPGERQLMADFSVSRATVREAMRVLQATGIVESRPGDPRGPLITAYSSKMLEKSMSRLASLESISRVELLQFRLLLEGHACLLAARNRTDADLERMDDALRGLEDALTGESGFGTLVNNFHAAIRHAAGNQLIEVCGNVVGGIMSDLAERRLLTEVDRRARTEQSIHDARVLIEAIRQGRAGDAQRISVQNIYRYYEGDLNAAEIDALASIIGELPAS
jgi:GntR family transcriptional repressor for pyruvate dehydrogenase complex